MSADIKHEVKMSRANAALLLAEYLLAQSGGDLRDHAPRYIEVCGADHILQDKTGVYWRVDLVLKRCTRVMPLHPFCNKCGWRKGGVDSWNGRACKCGCSEAAFHYRDEPDPERETKSAQDERGCGSLNERVEHG